MKTVLMNGEMKCLRKVAIFLFWDNVFEYEILAQLFIRVYQSNDFDLFVVSLEALVPWYLALDHTNYSQWIAVHIRSSAQFMEENSEDFQQHEQGLAAQELFRKLANKFV